MGISQLKEMSLLQGMTSDGDSAGAHPFNSRRHEIAAIHEPTLQLVRLPGRPLNAGPQSVYGLTNPFPDSILLASFSSLSRISFLG